MSLFTFGIKLVLIGGIIFTIALVAYRIQPSLGLEEQGLLSWVMMAGFIVWLIGAIYLGIAGDQWFSRGLSTNEYGR